MVYRSGLSRSRTSILASSVGIGALFSLVSNLSFGGLGFLNAAVSFVFGGLEGLLIGGTGMAAQALTPGPSRRRAPRMILVFLMASSVHGLLGLALLELWGARVLFLTGFVGLLSTLVGELVCARETAIIAREEAALASEGRSRLPPSLRERFGLSGREAEVAELLFARASYKDICDRLFISMPTVKSHVSAIYRKSDSSSRRDFIQAAERLR
jgi:DNA-binding CsgD family transcriptional regulator